MASVRKKYAGFLESRRSNDGPPVASMPTGGAELPPAVEAKPLEIEPAESPAEVAARNAISERLKEMERAEALQPQAVSPKPQLATEENPAETVIANSGLPPRAQEWLRQHPEYVLDAAKNNTLQALDEVAARQAGERFTDRYFDRMEILLGFKPDAPQQSPQMLMKPPQVTRQPVRQSGAPVSAPVARDVPSWSSGRPANQPMKLTAEERDLARTLGLTEQQYADNKSRMVALKAAGVIQDGR